jgi:hypothetical protein
MKVFQLKSYSSVSTLFERVAFEVELLRHAELGEIARDVALAVEEHAVPLLQALARKVEAGMSGKSGAPRCLPSLS